MYANVVVLTYGPPDIPTYSYKVPENLEKEVKVGQLVLVPFGKRTPMGVVVSLSKKEIKDIGEIRNIEGILIQQPMLLPYQIELLKWMAFYYRAPMVNCLEVMLPTKVLNAKRLMTNAKTISQSISRSSQVSSQTLVLTSSINRLPETLAKYPHAKNYAVYHNELKPWQRFNTWQKILSGNVDYIFGSRSAIFCPCRNLKEIIIYDEHDQGYHEERSPYYNAFSVAEKIQGLTGARIKIVDSSPRITTYFTHKVSPLARSHIVKAKIVNMLDERKVDNKTAISQILEDYIRLGYKRSKKILLFLNKKTESGHVYCRNCKYSEFAATAPEVCPNCRSFEIWFNSVNVNSLANLVRKIVPQAKVTIIAEGYKLLFEPEPQSRRPTTNYQLPTIDIATAAVFYKLLVKKYDLVAHVQTDSLLNITDYTSAEKLFAQISSLKKITRGLLLLQTYNPQDPTIVCASLGNYQKFFQDQLAERKALSYPPFSLLVKLTIKGKKEENLEEKASKLYAELNQSTVSILGPYKPQFRGKTAKYNIILKLPVKNYGLLQREMAMSAISPQLSQVPSGWQVEVETESII